ncbi:ankyrin [Parathielavia hyrcaniae]|uniref:Ankyrin n=1 Tax=Parathielavia hyrcaniae TaxID=113614 RepID=A0AAN6Q9G1_9PEZI|nr:ankyrin [Parathielavia hyrcaniae]
MDSSQDSSPSAEPTQPTLSSNEETSNLISKDSTMDDTPDCPQHIMGAAILLNALLTLSQTLKPKVPNTTNDDTTNLEDEITPLPLYTETSPSQIFTSTSPETLLTIILADHPSLTTLLSLPLTIYPLPLSPTWDSTAPNPLAYNPDLTDTEKQTLHTTQRQIITTFYDALAARDTALASLFIQHGLVSPDVPSSIAMTPLLAAVQHGDGAMVCTLVGLGAKVNGYGSVPSTRADVDRPERNALMLAAATGNLALVKLLVQDLGADDAIIAPDGQLALRLAADAGHREVVEFLPLRRGGAWRRWKTHHAVAVRRIKKAGVRIWWFFKVLLWTVPKFFVWDVPKHVLVKPVFAGCKYCWKNKHRFGGWCKRQAVEMPGRVKRAGNAVWKGMKKVPRGVWSLVKEVPGAIKRLVKWLWKVITRIPEAMKKICVWIWDSLKRLGKAVGHVFLRIVSVLHTAVAAVLDFFRNIKLKDVWNGVCDVFDAIFRGLPRVMLKILSSSGLVVAGIIIGLFGLAGKLLILLVQALWYVVQYVPRQLCEILAGMWTSIAKGYHEIMVWINPKH